jgi:hypothetical protein
MPAFSPHRLRRFEDPALPVGHHLPGWSTGTSRRCRSSPSPPTSPPSAATAAWPGRRLRPGHHLHRLHRRADCLSSARSMLTGPKTAAAPHRPARNARPAGPLTSTRTILPSAVTATVTIPSGTRDPLCRRLLLNRYQRERDLPARVPRAEHPSTNVRATRARSARPATVTLSRVVLYVSRRVTSRAEAIERAVDLRLLLVHAQGKQTGNHPH